MFKIRGESSHEAAESKPPNRLEKAVGASVATYVLARAIKQGWQWNKDKRSLTPNARDYYDSFVRLHDRYAKASDWDKKVDELIGRAIEARGAKDIKQALDLGAGTGLSVDAINNHSSPSRVVAVDVSSKMLEALRQKHPSNSVEVVNSKIEEYLDETDDRFDLITSTSSLEFLPHLPETLGQVTEHLNQGGVFIFTYVPRAEGGEKSHVNESPLIGQILEEYYWEQSEIEQSITDSGLSILETGSLDAYEPEPGEASVVYNFIIATKS